MEHMGWGLPLFNNFFHDLAAVLIVIVIAIFTPLPSSLRRRCHRAEYVGNGREWMKLHGTRSE